MRNTGPRYLLRDRDCTFGTTFRTDMEALGIKEVLSAPHAPWHWAYIERVIRSIRRECLNHVIVLNEASLRRTIQSYLRYYHECRTHLSLNKDAPIPRAAQSPACGTIVQVPHVGGLHHHYERRAA